MVDQGAPTQTITASPALQEVHRIGFWSAVLTTIWILVFDIAIGLGAGGAPTRLVAVGASLLLALSFVALSASLHHYAPPEKRVWSQIALSFAVIYAALILWNYYLQLTVVRSSPELYPWLTMAFTRETAFWSLEAICYTLMGLAGLFFLPILPKGRVERVIRVSFAVNAGLSLLGNAGYIASTDPMNVLVLISLGVWAVAFPTGTALLAVMFRREQR